MKTGVKGLVAVCLVMIVTSPLTSSKATPQLALELPGLKKLGDEIIRGIFEPMRPSARLILLILEQKCREWHALGYSPLPAYCWQFIDPGFSGRTLSEATLNGYYDQYVSTVSVEERIRDLLSLPSADLTRAVA